MKTKEEVIKEAWGKYWNLLSPKLKDVCLKSEGSIHERDFFIQFIELETKYVFEFFEYYNNRGIRPKSLQGLETNNGWIRIESEEDLNKDSNDYWVYDVNKNIDIRFYMSFSKKWGGHEMEVDVPEITHYQPIVKPKPPIY